MSDLIKQLGGFEKAEEYLEELSKIPMHEQTEDTIVYLPSALLEYRMTFETAFKETKEYKLHVDLGHMEEMYIFDRHPEEGWYYHPSVALAWKFYKLGAK